MKAQTLSVLITVDTTTFEKALRDIHASLRATSKAVLLVGKQARLLNRNMVRSMRRPALIHNGRKPR